MPALIIAVLTLLLFLALPGERRLPPGIYVPAEPRQQTITKSTQWIYKGAHITPLAHFDITGRVLARESYYFGTEATFSPLDLLLGWGLLSDQAVVAGL